MAPKKEAPGGRFAALRAEVSHEPYVLTPEIKIPPMTRRQMQKYLAVPATEKNAVETRYEIMFGEDLWPQVKELFADEPDGVWALFVKDMSDFFFGKKADDAPGGSTDSSSG